MIVVNGYKLYKKDKHNWVIEKKHIVSSGVNKGKETWTNDGYYVNLDYACNNLLEKLISDESGEDVIQSVQSLSDIVKISRNRIMKVVQENCDEFKKENTGE